MAEAHKAELARVTSGLREENHRSVCQLRGLKRSLQSKGFGGSLTEDKEEDKEEDQDYVSRFFDFFENFEIDKTKANLRNSSILTSESDSP